MTAWDVGLWMGRESWSLRWSAMVAGQVKALRLDYRPETPIGTVAVDLARLGLTIGSVTIDMVGSGQKGGE